MPCQQGVGRKRPSKNNNIKFTVTYRVISLPSSSNNTPSITSYGFCIIIKAVHEAKYNE